VPTFDSDKAMDCLGVPGRLTHRTTKPGKPAGLWFMQRWISQARPIAGYGEDAALTVELRFDDEHGNGHNTFAIMGEVRRPRRRDAESIGTMPEEIRSVFPELAHLLRWHMTASDGPVHYVANTLYLAGDRDAWGMRKGEERPVASRDGKARWELVAVNSLGVALSPTPTGLAYTGAETVPLSILQSRWSGDNPPVVPRLEWRQAMRAGEGKARELDKARNAAVWPDATDEELCAEPAELRRVLEARLPALLAAFRADMESIGFQWEPPAAEA